MLLREQVYSKIKEDILGGVYRMGNKLPVDELAKRYKVSKTPIREALTLLQHEGLVEAVPRAGYFVSYMTLKDLQNLFGLRLILEAAAAELAAQNITPEQLDALEHILCTYVPGDMDSCYQYLKDNREFHYRVALASGNEKLAEAVANVLDQMQGILLLEARLFDRAVQFDREHKQLVQALRQRDSELAKKLMTEAIENTRRAMLNAAIGERRYHSNTAHLTIAAGA
nr:GntR family transcriptional regulator [Chloroflexota bacterium]